MPKDKILLAIEKTSPDRLTQICQSMVKGLGFENAISFSLPGTHLAFQETILRQSTDKMFSTKETWLIAFVRNNTQATAQLLTAILETAQTTGMKNVMTVVFDEVVLADGERYHTRAKELDLRAMLLSGTFAGVLVNDYAQAVLHSVRQSPFSFASLRKRMKEQAQDASWRKQFLSIAALPVHIVEKRSKDNSGSLSGQGGTADVLNESDLFGAIHKDASFLLLGDPGSGKTTCLQELAEELASVGGRTPVFLPLNRYQGNLLQELGEILCEGSDTLAEKEVEALLATGALTVILDGVNEVQSHTFQPSLIKEINHFTNQTVSTARSHWIVSGRRYDYAYAPQLHHLDKHTWELLPLTADLIYQFLVNGLGEREGKDVYSNLSVAIRDICSNPLLLSMLLKVRVEHNQLPTNRGALYHQFIDLLLRRNEELPTHQSNLAVLSHSLGITLTADDYYHLAYSLLADLAEEMQKRGLIAISVGEVHEIFKDNAALGSALDVDKAATILTDSLLSRGILKYLFGRVSFFHHTFQEYFQAIKLREIPLEELIPLSGMRIELRESLVFLASTLDNREELQALIERILAYVKSARFITSPGHDREEVLLAYEIMRSASFPIEERIQKEVALAVWHNIVGGGTYVGVHKRMTYIFINIASRSSLSVEELARTILEPINEQAFFSQLLTFYNEAEDVQAQQQLVSRINLFKEQEIPEDLLFYMAWTAYREGNYLNAVNLYTRYIQNHENASSAYGNRATVYKLLGDLDKAEEDYKKAISLTPSNPVDRANYASLLIAKQQEDLALAELQQAVDNDPGFYYSHYRLGQLLVSKDPDKALFHLEKAANLVREGHEQIIYLKELLALQEKMGRFAGAMLSIRRLIDLDPTSREVGIWKQKFAHLRQAYTESQNQKPIITIVQEGREISLRDLAGAVLHAAGWQIDYTALQWLRAISDKSEHNSPLSVILLDVPQLTEELVRERISTLQNEEREIKTILLLTSAEAVEQGAYIELARSKHPGGFLTTVELREALLKGEQDCYQLLSNAIVRAKERANPFLYTKAIQERSEFFGRQEHLNNFISLVRNRQFVALYGIHKIGKSSLLRQVRQYLAAYERDITPVWIEMNASIKNSSELYRKILVNLSIDAGTPGSGTLSGERFEQALREFQKRKLRDYPRHQILLILDEYPYLLPNSTGTRGLPDFIQVLGLFKVMSQEGWFSLLPCGRTTALTRTRVWREDENPLIGMLKEQFLEPLTVQETEELIRVLGFKAGLNFTSEAIERIFALTGGHPFFTRTLGSWILTKHSSSRYSPQFTKDAQPSSITIAMVDDATTAYLHSDGDTTLLRKIYKEELEPEEQRIVKQLAVAGRPLPRVSLIPDNPTLEDRNNTRDAIKNLLAISVLKEDEHRHLSHRYELLRQLIVLDKAEDDDFFGNDE